MASRGVFSLLGRKAAAAGVAGASVAANQPSAHAREAVHAAAAPAPASTARAGQVLDDDWMEPHFEGQEVLVFRSFRPGEVDDAFASVQAALEQQQQQGKGATAAANSSNSAKKRSLLAVRAPLTIEEEGDTSGPSAGSSAAHTAAAAAVVQHASDPASPSSETDGSYGEEATDVLREPLTLHGAPTAAYGLSSVATTSTAAADLSNTAMSDLLQISRKLLTRPGLQREVFKCMVEDAEVRELMLRQSRNIDLYLQAVGVHTPAGLLADADGGSPAGTSTEGAGLRYRLPASVRARVQGEGADAARDADRGEEGEEGKDLLGKILDAVASCIDQTGSWLAGLGGRLRGRFLELGMLLGGAFGMVGAGHDDDSEEEDQDEGSRQQQRGRRGGRSAADVVLGAAMVVTVAVFCVLLARNPRLVVAAGTAAGAAAASSAKRQQAAMGGGGAPRS